MTSGSLRSNPAFGGSGHCRGGPKLPVKHSKKRLESLLHKAPRKTSPTRPSSKSKNRKRAAWGGGLETHEFRVDTVDLEEPLAVVEAQAPEPKKEEKLEKREEESDSSSDSSSLTSDSSSVPWCKMRTTMISARSPGKLRTIYIYIYIYICQAICETLNGCP